MKRIETEAPDEDGMSAMEPTARPPGRRWLVFAALLGPVIVLLGLFAGGLVRHQETLSINAALARGENPPVPAVTLAALDGPPMSLASLRGRPVIVNFWASWCLPCRDEAPFLEATWREFRATGLLVVGVDTQDLEAPARALLREFRITYPTLRDPDGAVARRFGTTGVPETFFIGRDGRIHGKFPGVEVRREAWRAAASALLAGQARIP